MKRGGSDGACEVIVILSEFSDASTVVSPIGDSLGSVAAQAATTFGIALLSSTLAVIYRCRNRGSLVASRATFGRATAVVVATACAATGIGVVLPLAAPFLPPALIGAAGPAAMDISSLPRTKKVTLRKIFSLGIQRLNEKLDNQLGDDRTSWIKGRVVEAWSPQELRDAAKRLSDYMVGRSTDKRRQNTIRRHYQTVKENADLEETAIWDVELQAASRIAAESAYEKLLELAYDWRHQDLVP